MFGLINNELRQLIKQPMDVFQPILFGLITLTLFVIAIGQEKNTLSVIAPAIVWVIVLLAILLSIDKLFHSDFEDGSLEQQQLAHHPFFMIVGIKIFSHWLLIILPLILIAPLFAKMLYFQAQSINALMLSLLLGTPAIVMFSALGSALTLTLKRGSLLLGLIVTPLNVPVLILAISAIQADLQGLNYSGQLALLAAAMLTSILVCLPAITFSLKLNN